MEKIDEIRYKGFKTEFYITGKVREYLEKGNIDLNELKQRNEKDNEDYSFFYEVFLFEEIDEDNDGIPDEKFGKSFKVVYYKVAKRKKEHNEELEQEIIEEVKDNFNFEDEISEGTKEITLGDSALEIKYKILMNQN